VSSIFLVIVLKDEHVRVVPCRTPALPPRTAPRDARAQSARRPASTPIQPHRAIVVNASKMPIALLPPPTQATIAAGSAPVRSRICWRASLPMTD